MNTNHHTNSVDSANYIDSVDLNTLKSTCHQCGKEFKTDEFGVTHHVNNNDLHNVDYELDQAHTPYEL